MLVMRFIDSNETKNPSVNPIELKLCPFPIGLTLSLLATPRLTISVISASDLGLKILCGLEYWFLAQLVHFVGKGYSLNQRRQYIAITSHEDPPSNSH